MKIARVALDLPLPRLADYLAGDADATDIGRLVQVEFGRRAHTGLLIQLTDQSAIEPAKLKPLVALRRDLPPLPARWLELMRFCSGYYQHPLGAAIATALPPGLKRGTRASRDREDPTSHGSAQSLAAFDLLPEQAQAVEAVARRFGSFAPFLLHGVTGSGKTEVYLRLIDAVLKRGGQALMLVPEIGLTPQLQARVAARFPGAHLVSLHSALAAGRRSRGFVAALRGEADIVLGTRLAAFAPLPRLGLIVVDEEHDPSFKQHEGMRYCARDVAVYRAKQEQVPIVMGSATPSLESYYHAQRGRYELLSLPRRAVAEDLPRVRRIDTRRLKLDHGLAPPLIAALEQCLARGEQSLVFLNRRGYAPVLACAACGWVSRCPHCSANRVLHMADHRLRCHHCGASANIPAACPDCGNQDLQPFGRGTQRLEAALGERFPAARVLRVDRDSAGSPARWLAVLEAIGGDAVDILVGTQMLAKGHDFPRLTLVGVLNADASLFAADFRAPERLFSQLMQVGGRSGRAQLPGEVLIQTEYPEHPLYAALADHDFARFAAIQLDERRQAGFPPFTFQALLAADASSPAAALEFLRRAAEVARALDHDDVRIYDAVPMRLARRADRSRAQLLVESPRRQALQAFLKQWLERLYESRPERDLRWHIDVDPLEC